jgi:hypothetical protein
MAFDPTLPQTNALIRSAELRTQFTGLFVAQHLSLSDKGFWVGWSIGQAGRALGLLRWSSCFR